MEEANFSDIWRSTYGYHSSSRNGDFEGEHAVRLHQDKNQLVAESVPGSASYLIMRLSFDGNVATGSWQEQTQQDGHYKGAIYHGAVQLVVDKTQKRMSGKWVGFGKDMQVNVGPWELVFIGDTAEET